MSLASRFRTFRVGPASAVVIVALFLAVGGFCIREWWIVRERKAAFAAVEAWRLSAWHVPHSRPTLRELFGDEDFTTFVLRPETPTVSVKRLRGAYPEAEVAFGGFERGGDVAAALANYTEQIRLKPGDPDPLAGRGFVWSIRGDWSKARADFEEAIRLDPTMAAVHNNLGWHFATLPNAKDRDGKRAMEHAKKACELSEFRNAGYLDTLAAAHAETGDFAGAVEWMEKALALTPADAELQRHRDAFQAGRTWREALSGKD